MHINLTHQSYTSIPHTLISHTLIPHIDIAASHRPSHPLPQDIANSSYYYILVQRVYYFILATEGYSITKIKRKTGVLKHL